MAILRRQRKAADVPEAEIERLLDTPEGQERQLQIASKAAFMEEHEYAIALARQVTRPMVRLLSVQDGGRGSVVQPGEIATLDVTITSADGARVSRNTFNMVAQQLVELEGASTRLFRTDQGTLNSIAVSSGQIPQVSADASFIAIGLIPRVVQPYKGFEKPMDQPTIADEVLAKLTGKEITRDRQEPLGQVVNYNEVCVGRASVGDVNVEHVVTVLTETSEGLQSLGTVPLYMGFPNSDLQEIVGENTMPPTTIVHRVQSARRVPGLDKPVGVTVLHDGSYGRIS